MAHPAAFPPEPGTGRADPDRLYVHDPENGGFISSVQRTKPDDIGKLLDVAERGARISHELPAARRAEILTRASALVTAQSERLAQLIAGEGVKTIREARRESARCAETFALCASTAGQSHAQSVEFVQKRNGINRSGHYEMTPLGIIAAITPFNDPLNLVAHKIGPAIATGNSVILKPHEATPLSALAVLSLLQDAGLPEDVVSIAVGDGRDLVPMIVGDDRVRMVSFTGSRAVGHGIAKAGGLKRYAMELGGVCPTIVCADIDLSFAVSECVSGGYWAAGQNCLHTQRILIHADVYADFREMFLEAVGQYRLGPKRDNATDMGCLINEAAAARVEAMVASAVRSGAKLILGGQREFTRITPTVLEDVRPNGTLLSEEIFGPVVTLERYTSLPEAVARTHSGGGAIHAAIFTGNAGEADYAARHMQAGGVMINGGTDFRDDAMPFGGVGAAGFGREGVSFAAAEMMQAKLFCTTTRTQPHKPPSQQAIAHLT